MSACVRCKKQPGIVLVHNVCGGSGDSARGQQPVMIPLYACLPCAERIDPAAARVYREQQHR